MEPEWLRRKADVMSTAWLNEWGTLPTRHAVALSLAVAIHETVAGEAKGWEGEHNYGAIQKRTPTPAERAVIGASGIVADPHNVGLARAAIQAAIDDGKLPALDHEALHVDSSPGRGWYWVYFWAYPTDVEGAQKFVQVLTKRAGRAATCKTILESEHGEETALARAMYMSHYFEGFRVPDVWYVRSGMGWTAAPDQSAPGPAAVKGSALNVADYAGALARLTPAIRAALDGWDPTEPPEPIASANPLPLEVDWDQFERDRDAAVLASDTEPAPGTE